MSDSSYPANSTAEREITIARIVDGSCARVFEAFTDPRQVALWWGPDGFTNTVKEMDVRPGGVWRFDMHGPDGVNYPNKIVYEEVAHAQRLTFLHGDDVEGDAHSSHVTATFTDEAGKTRVTMCTLFDTVEERDRVATEYNAIENGKQTLERLAKFLEPA